jgi:sucrose-6-phosphate hydrolase SacC (GH32 family)
VNENPPDTTLWVDYGKDFYASLSFSDISPSDGRRIWMGWMSNWLYAQEEPTSPWRGVQSLPRELALERRPEGIRLVQAPIAELRTLRVATAPRGIAKASELPPSAEIEVDVARGEWSEAGLRLANSAGEEVVVGVAAHPLEVFVDRRRSRATPFHEAYPGRHAGPVRWREDRVRLRILFDRTTIEVFANDGETVVSDRLYPTQSLERLETLAEGRGVVTPMRLWELRPVWK